MFGEYGPWFLRVCSTSLENAERKGEIARKEFYRHLKNFVPFSPNFKLSSANSCRLEVSKICCLGKGSICLSVFLCRINLSNFTFFHNVFPKLFPSMC